MRNPRAMRPASLREVRAIAAHTAAGLDAAKNARGLACLRVSSTHKLTRGGRW